MADTGLALRYRFAGREYDAESGLYYMRARYYDPALGRWLSEDPIGVDGGANLFAYSGDDPVNNVDPSGTSYFGPNGSICEDYVRVRRWYTQAGVYVYTQILEEWTECKGGWADPVPAGDKGAQRADAPDKDCDQATREALLSAAVDAIGGGFRILGALRTLSRSDALLRSSASLFRNSHGLEGAAGAVLSGSGFRVMFESFALRSAAGSNLLRGTVGVTARATLPSVPHPMSQGPAAIRALLAGPSGEALYNLFRALPITGTGVRAYEAYQACSAK